MGWKDDLRTYEDDTGLMRKFERDVSTDIPEEGEFVGGAQDVTSDRFAAQGQQKQS